MTITHQYLIKQLVCEQQIQNRPDNVVGVHVAFIATDASNNMEQSTIIYFPLVADLTAEFTPFDQLTDAQMRAWLESRYANKFEEVKMALEMQLMEAAAPSSLLKLPPWYEVQPITLTYQEQRSGAYPAIREQLDMLWHAMNNGEIPQASAFYTALKAVKDQFPKV